MTWPEEPVRVRVPATSANLGPGFDSLGLALGLHDVVEATVIDGGLRIEVTGIGEHAARFGEKHLVVRSMRAAFEALGESPPGLALRCANAMPHGFGLGSSAAAIVAGILAARELCGEAGCTRLPDEAVLRLAADLEGHADNVAACLAGGLTIAWTADTPGAAGPPAPAPSPSMGFRCARLEPLPGLVPVLCVPAVPLATEVARQVLPATVPHADAANNAARSALLIAALTQPELAARPGLLLEATRDFLHQPYRASSMPASASLLGALREAGIPAVVSGAGPAVLALIVPGAAAGADTVAAIAAASGAAWTVTALAVDRAGATVLPRLDLLGRLCSVGSARSALFRQLRACGEGCRRGGRPDRHRRRRSRAGHRCRPGR
ncbi:MAG TPA: homoserine kinase [Streptosporangiaceae bacterium]